jgi:hypothetical protein
MANHVQIPVKVIGTERWGMLSWLGVDTHLVCGESVKLKDEQFSFAGGHRVRLFLFKKNVAFKVPEGVPLDIAGVPPANAPRRSQR